MLSLFRTNHFASNILLVFYVLLLRGTVFFVPQPVGDAATAFSHPGILSRMVYGAVGQEGLAADVLALMLVLIQGLMVNVIAAKYRIAPSVTLFPGVFYILIASSFPAFLHLSPVLMANTFLLFALYSMLDFYKKFSVAGAAYNVGLWMGVAALFYYSMLVFVLAAVVGFAILRSLKVRELLMMLCGVLSPYWLLGAWCFYNGQMEVFWEQALSGNMGMVRWRFISEWVGYILPGVFGLLLLIVLLSYRRYTSRVNVKTGKYIDVMYWLLLATVFTLLMQKGIDADHFLIMVVPLSVLFSMTMLRMNPPLAEALHFLWLVGILLWQTKPLWWAVF